MRSDHSGLPDRDTRRRLAERALRDAGYEVVLALDGPEALRIVVEQGSSDVSVIEIMMPEIRDTRTVPNQKLDVPCRSENQTP